MKRIFTLVLVAVLLSATTRAQQAQQSAQGGLLLPVSLDNLAVNYNNGIATISWKTYQEFSLIKYVIERSTDGVSFSTVGSLPATNITTIQQYQYTDNAGTLNARYLFYRIKTYGSDGINRLSSTVSTRTGEQRKNELTIVPNPSKPDARIRLMTDNAGKGNIMVFDISGKLVLKQESAILKGTNNITLNNISTLTEGQYTVKLVVSGETYSTKMIIWK